jgi:hypothetical protein
MAFRDPEKLAELGDGVCVDDGLEAVHGLSLHQVPITVNTACSYFSATLRVMNIKEIMRAQGARLADARKDAGFKSGRSAALANGWAESTYSAHEGGRRTIGQDDAEKYVRAFRAHGAKSSAEYILFGDGWRRNAQSPRGDLANTDNILRLTYSGNEAHSGGETLATITPAARPILVSVRGLTANGLWFEYEKMIEADYGLIPAVPGKYYPMEQFAYRVSDNAMDKRDIRSGNFIICVSYQEARADLQTGDIVVAERSVKGKTERSCRELRIVGDGYELWSRSSEPHFETPIRVKNRADSKDDDGVRVDIIGLVIAAHVPIGR